ncbi:hypothetical protein pdam_00013669 [Pocillopora damicornis]|uniref:Amino acid transporter transmembrane domain-containing protein n=1 Tax=Pocillopora damicornis TaxID=46731 RepID=A0A3M6UK90_POCDA|nr:hypothetical protein pdam_00013669 [Pocillopora damicornis]
MSETTGYRLLKNHTEEGEEEREGKEHEKKILIQEEDAAGQNEESAERSSLWKAVANLMSSIEGTGLLALPYVIAESGLVAIAALVVVPFITYYTGAILIECLYETNNEGERIRVRSNYKELGKACWPRFGGAIVAAVQLIELFMLASLYLVLCASLSSSIFPGIPVSDKIWMVIAATIGFPTIFVKNISQAAWFSLVSVVALSVAVIAVLAFGIAHGSKWNLNLILVRNIDEAPVSLALIIFSFICHPILPGVEESLQNRSQFRKMLALSYTFVAILKIFVLSCRLAQIFQNPDIPDVIVNSLPMGFLRVFVNGFLILNVLFSYPFRVITIIHTIEEIFSVDSLPFRCPEIVWFIGIRVFTNFLTLLPAISIPHFALFMSFIGSLTGSCVALIFPAVFHLNIQKDNLKLYQITFDILVIFVGVFASFTGLIFTGKKILQL